MARTRHQSLAVLLVLFVLSCSFPETVRAQESGKSPVGVTGEPYLLPSLSDGSVFVEMLGQIEVLTAIQSQTTWMKTHGPRGGTGNDYFRAVSEFMSRHKDHEAVKVCQELLDREWSFAYDAPVYMALHWGPLPDLELVHEYDDYLVRRAGGRENLERFRTAARSFVRDSNYLAFLEEWRPKFEAWVRKVVAEATLQETRKWLEEFSGVKAGEFHLVLSPATFYGSYGPKIPTPDGGFAAYCVACAYPGSGDPYFGSDIDALCLHELGHSFVNPAVLEFLQTTDIRVFEPLFRGVRKEMQRQAYSDTRTIVIEQILRAVTCLAAQDLEGADAYERWVTYEESRSFYLTRYLAEKLQDEYVHNRKNYPTFRDYVPFLLRDLEAKAQQMEQDRVLRLRIIVALIALVLPIGGTEILRRLRKKRTAE